MSNERQQPKFKTLYLSRGYGDKMQGTLEFGTTHGDMKLNLTEEQSLRMITLVADTVVEEAGFVANAMKEDVADRLLLLTNGGEEAEGREPDEVITSEHEDL